MKYSKCRNCPNQWTSVVQSKLMAALNASNPYPYARNKKGYKESRHFHVWS